MDFDWDPVKAELNWRKHQVPFDAAIEVFLDPNRVDFDVSRDGEREERRKAVGVVTGRILSLVYTMRDGRMRVISARAANAQEKRRYGYR